MAAVVKKHKSRDIETLCPFYCDVKRSHNDVGVRSLTEQTSGKGYYMVLGPELGLSTVPTSTLPWCPGNHHEEDK